jgi:hypothetical protein
VPGAPTEKQPFAGEDKENAIKEADRGDGRGGKRQEGLRGRHIGKAA